MRYTSTRNGDIDCSFAEAITSGYAEDGGLFVPRSLPSLTGEMLSEWSKLSYPVLMERVIRLFVGTDEVTDAELQEVSQSALEGFVDPLHAIPIVPLSVGTGSDCSRDESTSFYVSELFHGPTFCFKDLGMRAVIQLLSLFATKRKRAISLLVSTTGDTGPAAVKAVSDIGNPLLKIAVHFPHQQISDFQRMQMTTVHSPCVRVVAFQGGGDDMDTPIKRLLASKDKLDKEGSLWTGVNSYNIGRPIMQMVLYIWTYLRIVDARKWVIPVGELSLQSAHTIDLILPTGAMGNIAAGYMVKRMGLPIGRLVAAVNVNDITHQAFAKGSFHRSDRMQRTLSEAINIQIPYNFERLLYYLTDCNHSLVQTWYDGLALTGKIDLDAMWLEKLQATFGSARVTDAQMCEAAATAYTDYRYLADPHTAVAFSAAYQCGYLRSPSTSTDAKREHENAGIRTKEDGVTVLLATASPCKFEHAVVAAVGRDVWNSYLASNEFPLAAKQMLNLHEVPLFLYPAKEGSSLTDTQLEWEELAREVVATLEQNTSR